jgi:hypothetical protein
MEEVVIPWRPEQRQVDLLERFIAQDDWEITLAQIPSLFGNSDAATFLGYRALGFKMEQALQLAGLPRNMIGVWAEYMPRLLEFESEHLLQLQQQVGPETVRLAFIRNLSLTLHRDGVLIQQDIEDPESLSNREFKQLLNSRRYYTTEGLLSLEKALHPEKHKDMTAIQLVWGTEGLQLAQGGGQDNSSSAALEAAGEALQLIEGDSVSSTE